MKIRAILLAAGVAVSIGLGSVFTQTTAQTSLTNMSPEQCREAMKKMGMSDAMITRCQLMGTAQFSAYDPATVLALRDELKLTDDQTKELEAIAAKTQEDVKAKLKSEQVASLQPIAGTPSSMMQMWQSMHSMTGKNMMGWMMCPMMSAAAKNPGQTRMMCCPWMTQ